MQSLKKIHAWAQMKVPLSVTMSVSKIFIPNFVGVLANKRKYILNRIFILLLGSCPRGGTWGCWGGQKL